MLCDRGNVIGAETELNKAKEEMDDNINEAASLRLKSIELKSQHLPPTSEVCLNLVELIALK